MSGSADAEPRNPGLPPAPGADRYPALDLANSAVVLPGGQRLDLLGEPSAAGRWLVDRALAPEDAELREICAARMRALRDQVRALFAALVDGQPPPGAALTAVNDALTRVPTAAPLGWDRVRGPYRTAPHPVDQIVDQALGILAANAADLLTGPDAERLTACPSTPCDRYLLRAGRRHWCSVRCGDRARAARAYARRTGNGDAEAPHGGPGSG
ncbi:CGNR zinc finger domain-containing protein [Streptomyces hainanensis]|uniref:CGNR zinc finger domain-containing protein n=1 Tax=Streptomyces hainanensis TaxID=402648 RepID=UPI001FB67FBC|nr:ABATE domain-containing protein [Streptomyces hainanensis]